MTSSELLIDAYGRITELVDRVADGLDPDAQGFRPDPDANSIAWLIWHLTRVQDDHLADASGTEQCWTSEGWYERVGLPFDPDSTGYGHSSADVALLAEADLALLVGYHHAVHDRTVAFLSTLSDDDLDRVVDTRWNPPVTLGVRLVSVVSDNLQHAGQAAYVRGVASRRV